MASMRTGVPERWDFYHVADNATEKDQDLFMSASIDNQTTADFHNIVRYGADAQARAIQPVGADGQLVEFSIAYGDQLTAIQ